MILVIATQDRENYAAHQGFTGEYYWKMKGGNDYMFNLGPAGRSEEALDELAEIFRKQIEENNDGYREYIIGYGQVADDFFTDFERSQLEYDGEIVYPARQLKLEEVA
jgi:hypothetical protein